MIKLSCGVCEMKLISKLLKNGESETVEFKPSFSNEVIMSLTAFANTKGGVVILGVLDSGKVCGVKLKKETIQVWINEIKNKTTPILIPDVEVYQDEDQSIVTMFVKEDPIKPIAFKGRCYKRLKNSNHLLSVEEVANIHLQTFNSSWDYSFDPDHDIQDISLDKVESFVKLINQNRNIPITDEPLSVLQKLELIRDDKISKACFLLFMKNNSLLTTVELGRFQTETLIKDGKRIKGDIFSEVEEILDFVKKHINKEYIITGNSQREEKWQYPMEALREIVLNAVVHRDYSSPSDSVIKIFDDRIEFYNPGKLPASISVKKLLSGDYVSVVRNKQIADSFKESGKIEKYGSGIKRIIEAFQAYELIVPQFQEIGEGFCVTVFAEKTPQKTPQKPLFLKDKILEAIRQEPIISREGIAQLLGLSPETVKEYIAKLKSEKRIERIGGDRGGSWKVKE